MKRVYIRIPDNIGDNINIFMEAEGIHTWSKGVIKLLDLGLRFYCKKDVDNLTNNNNLIMAKLKEIQNENRQLCLDIDAHVKSLGKNKNENN